MFTYLVAIQSVPPAPPSPLWYFLFPPHLFYGGIIGI